jgi:hypothetical protein
MGFPFGSLALRFEKSLLPDRGKGRLVLEAAESSHGGLTNHQHTAYLCRLTNRSPLQIRITRPPLLPIQIVKHCRQRRDLEYTNLWQAYRELPAGEVFRLSRASCSLWATEVSESEFCFSCLGQTLGILLSPEWSVACFDRPGLLSPRTFLGGLAVLAAYLALTYWSGNP